LVAKAPDLIERLVQGFQRIGIGRLFEADMAVESWTKEKPEVFACAEPISRDDGTPPATVQSTPVPPPRPCIREPGGDRAGRSSRFRRCFWSLCVLLVEKTVSTRRLGSGPVYSRAVEKK